MNETLNRTVAVDDQNPDKVVVTTFVRKDRYTPCARHSQDECEFVVERIMNDCKIYSPCRDYTSLNNFDLDDDELTGNLYEDLDIFTKKVGDGFDCYILGAYIHSGTSFSISKEGDHRCRFDSGQLGFIAIPKNYKQSPSDLADDLTNAWEGGFVEYSVYDELKEEFVDSLVTASWSEARDFTDKCKLKYGVDFDDVTVEY